MAILSNDHQLVGGKQYFSDDVQLEVTPKGIRRDIYTPAADADNCLGAADSFLYFFCASEDQWLVRIVNRVEGTGASGAYTQSTS